MPPASERISRKNALEFFAAAAGLFALKSWGFSVPDAVEEDPVAPFAPGWLEKRNPDRPAFIYPEMGGHRDYLRYMIIHDPTLKKNVIQAYVDLAKPTDKPRPSLSSVFGKHVMYAQNALPLGAPIKEALHVAFFTFAAVHSNFFTNKEMKEVFGVNINFPLGEGNTNFYVGEFEKRMPLVFPDNAGREGGVDKSLHFGNFAFLVHQYWYAERWGLQEAQRVPNAARVFASTAGSREKDAGRLAELGGWAWETFETIDWIREMFKQRQVIWPPETGLFDPDVPNDFRANKLGVLFALSLVGDSLTENQVFHAIRSLDNPEALLAKAQ